MTKCSNIKILICELKVKWIAVAAIAKKAGIHQKINLYL